MISVCSMCRSHFAHFLPMARASICPFIIYEVNIPNIFQAFDPKPKSTISDAPPLRTKKRANKKLVFSHSLGLSLTPSRPLALPPTPKFTTLLLLGGRCICVALPYEQAKTKLQFLLLGFVEWQCVLWIKPCSQNLGIQKMYEHFFAISFNAQIACATVPQRSSFKSCLKDLIGSASLTPTGPLE